MVDSRRFVGGTQDVSLSKASQATRVGGIHEGIEMDTGNFCDVNMHGYGCQTFQNLGAAYG